VDKRGTVKILDFGLALAGGDDGDASLTQAFDEKVLGTADYLAPEQARNSHQADRRSDVYALGCTFHFLLTGRAPFAKGSISERLQAHLTKPPPNLLEARADVPAPIAELYFRMLEKHPEARPQTAQEVADSLAAWLAANASGGPRTRPEPPRRAPPPRRSPAPAGDPGLSNVHYAPPRPGRTGSTSGSSGIRSGSGPLAGGDSGPFGDWAGGSAGRGTAAAAAAKTRPDAATAPVLIDTGSKPSAAAARVAKKARKPLQFAGLPLGFWLLALGGVVLAIGLAIAVFSK
jgi:serine/threonine protein kinase